MSAPAHWRWPAIIVVALAPLWIVGILDRSTWTPDEPREADIAWRMSLQADRTLPHLADTPFLEKPPFSYWLAAAAVGIFGDTPQAARAPNFLYALATALAIGALATTMAGSLAGIVAALATGSALLTYRTSIWLAPDAALLAGCALALWGVYLGLDSPPGRRKLLGYTLMHAGAALGFMAKSAPGWLVPALALAGMIAWERRWRELLRWELYAGLLVQAAIIAPWIHAVTVMPQGREALRALFWHNVVGRFMQVSAPQSLDYTTGHHNSPLKYWIELPVYLLPWTLIAAAAVRRAWSGVRAERAAGRPWRFAIAATVPFLLLLSIAATARDVYAAPALLGFGILIGLWMAELGSLREASRFDRLALRATAVTVIVLIASFAAMLSIVAAAMRAPFMWVTVAALAAIAVGVAFAAHLERIQHDGLTLVRRLYVAYVAAFALTALALFPIVDRWQDLASLARRIHADAGSGSLAVLEPDETTIAMLDHGLRTPFTALHTDSGTAQQAAAGWFHGRGAAAHLLIKLPGRTPGPVSAWIGRFHPVPAPGDGVAAELVADGVASISGRYELPEGRRYALLQSAHR